MEPIYASFTQGLASAVVLVASGVITALFSMLYKVINQRMQAGIARDVVLERMHNAESAVRSVEQVLKPILLEKAADGKLTKDDLTELKTAGVNAMKDAMANKSLEHIEANSKSVDAVLGQDIEAAISRKKDALSIAPPRMFPAPSEPDELSFRRDSSK